MIRLAELSEASLKSRLTGSGLAIHAPPFTYLVKSPLRLVEKGLRTAYDDFLIADDVDFVDFELTLAPVQGPRRWLKPMVQLSVDGSQPFDALPAAQAFPLLEWGMNWCVTTTAHHLVMCHSAVLAWKDLAVMLPAPPGSGKSTLCAALALSGWRLLSDELTLIDPESGAIQAFVRPVSLKNASIEVIGMRYPDAVFTQTVNDTIKGSVAHMRPPTDSILQGQRPALPRWLVFPKYEAGVALNLTEMSKAEALTELIGSTFNFSALGVRAFSSLGELVDSVDCYRLHYASLDQAESAFAELARTAEAELA